MQKHFCCPKCGNREVQATVESNTQTTGKNYSSGQGCLGLMMFGPLGLLCGSCGQGQQTHTTNTTYWLCPKCGEKFRHPDDIRKELKAKEKIPDAMLIFGLILALIELIAFGHINFGIAFFLAILMFGTFAVCSYGAKQSNENIAAELYRIEKGMAKFER